MTLERRLVAGISALFLVALIGVQLIHLRHAQRHLQGQLESLSQDAATAIGLSLGLLLREGDMVLAQTAINPAFDRGHYERIELVGMGGDVLAGRTLSQAPLGAYPRWFAEFFPLHGPTTESLVTSGWRQVGKLRVTVHPRFAYERLWATARDTVLYLLAIYAAALVALRLFMLGVLRPLRAIERAAEAVAAGNYVQIGERPSTRELAQVVRAMNAMSRNVASAIADEATRADALQRAAQQDGVTGLLNRRSVLEQFENAYAEDHEPFAGVFALVELDGLAELDGRLGHERCDRLLRNLADLVQGVADREGGLAARWSASVFALALPGVDEGSAHAALSELRDAMELAAAESGAGADATVRVGAVVATSARTGAATLTGAAQGALARASLDAGRAIEVQALAKSPSDAASAEGVRDALAEGRLRLFAQRVYALPDQLPIQVEVMARLLGRGGELLPAAEIMPVVSQHGMTRRLDERVVEAVMDALRAAPGAGVASVNLSVRSLAQEGFVEWLASAVRREPGLAGRMVFEVSEHGAIHHRETVARLAAALRDAGSAFTIDHFGMHRDSLALAQRLRPAWLKLAPRHTAALPEDAGSRFLVESLLRAAQYLEIPVIAQNVETPAQLEAIRAMAFSGYQGYLPGAPAPWPFAD